MSHFNKFLKMLFAVEFILILLIIILVLVESREVPTAYVIKENMENLSNEKIKFKILTKAVCEERVEHIFCRDELFVKCNDEEYAINKNNIENFTECGIKLNLSDIEVNGSTVFKKEWADPRK